MTQIEQIRAEIERRMKIYDAIIESQPGSNRAEKAAWKWAECKSILSFIDTLEGRGPGLPGIEGPGIPGKDYIPVEWVDACERYGKWKIIKVQPEVDLEKLLKIELPWMVDDAELGLCVSNHFGNHRMKIEDVQEIARHFYELGRSCKIE